MYRKKILYIAQLGAVGFAGYSVGQYKGKLGDNNDENNIIVDGKTIKNMPGLPIFGTVSAAAPYTDGGTAKDRISQIMKYGFPGLDNVRSFDDYVLSYDRRNRVPHWVFEHLTKAHMMKNDQVDRSKCDFMPDESIHPFFRSQNKDYKGSGFDRGHMAAAGNHRLAQKHVEQTFYLTNMAPQVGEGFNRHAWNRLEKHVRKLAKVYDNVYCCTGPLYLPKRESDGKCYVRYQVIGANSVAVPTHFYKVVVGEAPDGTLDMEAYVMPNQKIPDETPVSILCVAVPTHFYKVVVGEAPDGTLDMEAYVMPNQKIPDETPVSNFMVPPETIEKAAGLLFFDKIHRSKLNRINGKKI